MVDRVGQQLGKYRLTRLLGRGGFAEVYLGEHVRLSTLAAIKVLHTQIANEDEDNFHEEARTIARLEHPNIIRVLDFDVEDGLPFLVLHYAPNGTLRQRHPRGVPLPLVTIISYAKQIADALQYAHDEKLIHRDIKPENMLMGRRNEVLLSDFGIATLAQSSRYQSTQNMVGTVMYMAPEQIQGKPRPASDQYALGVVIYEWLSGERPFQGSFTEVATQHVLAPPPPLHEKIPTISPALEQVVLTALEKDPHRRFGSISAFATALEQASQETFLSPAPIVGAGPFHPVPQTPVVPLSQASLEPSLPVIESPVSITPSNSPQIESPILPTTVVTPPTPNAPPAGTIQCIYRGHSNWVFTVSWSPDDSRIASGSSDGTVQVWDLTEKRLIYHGHSGSSHWVKAVSWSPRSNHIASGGTDKTVQVWDATTNAKVRTYPRHTGIVEDVAWSPDGGLIASASGDKTVHVWDSATGQFTIIYSSHSAQVNAVAWSPDGKCVASASNDRTVHVWDVGTGRMLLIYNGHAENVVAVAWSPDGAWIASGSHDKTVQVWDAITGKCLRTYSDHVDGVRTVKWAPNGLHLASGGYGKTVRVWDFTTGELVFTYGGHLGSVESVAWSSDGTRIASASNDSIVQVWVAP